VRTPVDVLPSVTQAAVPNGPAALFPSVPARIPAERGRRCVQVALLSARHDRIRDSLLRATDIRLSAVRASDSLARRRDEDRVQQRCHRPERDVADENLVVDETFDLELPWRESDRRHDDEIVAFTVRERDGVVPVLVDARLSAAAATYGIRRDHRGGDGPPIRVGDPSSYDVHALSLQRRRREQ
jgi:hypothetical protein